jgi:hypothetical protein
MALSSERVSGIQMMLVVRHSQAQPVEKGIVHRIIISRRQHHHCQTSRQNHVYGNGQVIPSCTTLLAVHTVAAQHKLDQATEASIWQKPSQIDIVANLASR